MSEQLNVPTDLESAIDLLSDMILHYLSVQERKSARRKEVMAWLEPIMLQEAEEMANRELTAQLLGTWDYELVA